MKKLLFIIALVILTSCTSHMNPNHYALDTMQPVGMAHESGVADENVGGGGDADTGN